MTAEFYGGYFDGLKVKAYTAHSEVLVDEIEGSDLISIHPLSDYNFFQKLGRRWNGKHYVLEPSNCATVKYFVK